MTVFLQHDLFFCKHDGFVFQPVLHTISHTILHTILQAWPFFLHTIWQDVDRGQGGPSVKGRWGATLRRPRGCWWAACQGARGFGGEAGRRRGFVHLHPHPTPHRGPPAKGLGGRGAVVERSTTTEDTNNYAQSLWPSQALSVGGWPINVRLLYWAPRVCRYQYPRIHNMYNWAHTFKQGHQTNMMRHSTKNIHILSYEGFPRNPNTFA